MTPPKQSETGIERSRQELRAAHFLADGGFNLQAVSRAYYAAFYAAEAALSVLGESRSKHTGVISAFGRLVVRTGGVDKEVGSLLSLLFEHRNAADYESVEMNRQDAEAAIADAERFVDVVATWLETRASG